MGLFDKWLKSKSGDSKPPDHAVFVYFKLSDDDMGDGEIDDAIYSMEEDLRRLIETSGSGEFDGDEWGGGLCQLFIYGPDADRLFEVIQPELLKAHGLPLTRIIKRYGGPGAQQTEMQWAEGKQTS